MSQGLKANSQKLVFLAGPLGFEPRQSAPKALDLPLVDGPVCDFRFAILDFRLRSPSSPVIIRQSEISNLTFSTRSFPSTSAWLACSSPTLLCLPDVLWRPPV